MPSDDSKPNQRKRVVDRRDLEEIQRMEIGRRITLVRERLGHSRRTFAAMFGVDHTTMKAWEIGETYAPLTYALWLWQQYQIPPEWFLLGDDRRCPKWLVESLLAEGTEKRVELKAEIRQIGAVVPESN